MKYLEYKKNVKRYIMDEKTYFSAILMWLYFIPKLGFIGSFRGVLDKKLFDMSYGVNTNSVTKIDDQDYLVRNSIESVLNQAQKVQSSSIYRYKLAIDFLKEEYQGDISKLKFIDIGSGKGRVLILAKNDGFRNVIGVELSYSMIQIANLNLFNLGIKNVTLQECNAADYNLPTGGLILYLFNPFGIDIIKSFVSKILDHSEIVYVIYSNPVHSEFFEKNNIVEVIYPVSGKKDKSNKKLKIYKFSSENES